MNEQQFNKLPLGTVLIDDRIPAYTLNAKKSQGLYFIDVKTGKHKVTCVDTNAKSAKTVGDKLNLSKRHRVAPPSVAKLYKHAWK